MNKSLHQQNIDELQETLASAQLTTPAEKISTILISKSIKYLSNEIGILKEAMHDDIAEIVASSKRLTRATWVYSIVMLGLTTAIAISALTQAGIVNFTK